MPATHATQAVTVGQSAQKQRHRFGLWGKLILAILAAGTIPILVGLSVAYLKGRTELPGPGGSDPR